jgi:hypothetical protein
MSITPNTPGFTTTTHRDEFHVGTSKFIFVVTIFAVFSHASSIKVENRRQINKNTMACCGLFK